MLKLRKVRESDLEKIMNWRMKPDVTKYMYTDPVITIEQQKKWFLSVEKDASRYDWIIQYNGTDIGLLTISDVDEKNSKCSWAYYIGETDLRGQGLGRILECNVYDFVFGHLSLNKLCCEVFAFNDKVVKIHEHFGMRREGYYRQHIIKNEEKFDVVTMAILKEEWELLRIGAKYEQAEFEL